jgi:hypothetical protein
MLKDPYLSSVPHQERWHKKERRPKLAVTRQARRSMSRHSKSVVAKVKLSDYFVNSRQINRQASSEGIVTSP